MDWISEAKALFALEKPLHFTDYRHCTECAEHDATLLASEVDTIRLAELGNPGWDPVCFCSTYAKQYLMPAFIRLTLESMRSDFYLQQFLFHLEGDGEDNELYMRCSVEQRRFIVAFIGYLIDQWSDEVEGAQCVDDVLRVYQIWSKLS